MPEADSKRKLFISYSRLDKARVYPFADALLKAGVDIWIDKEEIEPLGDFPLRIREGLASSHAFLAWYSSSYAKSKYCQQELTAAWMAARRLSPNVVARIFIANPEASVSHIALGDLNTENFLAAPHDPASLAIAIQAIGQKLAGLSAPFGVIAQDVEPPWYPPPPHQSSSRFVGRLRELWSIHTALNPVGIFQPPKAGIAAILRGFGGVGKSLLAIEYANRFRSAFPGGIYWLRAHGFDPKTSLNNEQREIARRGQTVSIAEQRGIESKDKPFSQIAHELAAKLAADPPYLWIVDDMPPGLDLGSVAGDWLAPTPNGCTLITTRSADYNSIGTLIEVDKLDPDSAFQLLTQNRKPQTDQDRQAAQGLADDLGYHALALDVAGSFLLKTISFADLRQRVTQPSNLTLADPLGKLVEGLSGQLPGGHEKSIVATILSSIQLLKTEGQNLLRLAVELNGTIPISKRLAQGTLQIALSLDAAAVEDYFLIAVNQAETNSLALIEHRAEDDVFSVHSLTRYTMLHADPAPNAVALREKMRQAAVSTIMPLLRDVGDIRKHKRIEDDVAHARFLVLSLSTSDDALLYTWLAGFEDERGGVSQALAMYQQALPILQQALGPSHREVLTVKSSIASLTGKSGNAREALRLSTELLPKMVQAFGANDPDTLKERYYNAFWIAKAGQPIEALRLFNELLPFYLQVFGPDDSHTLQLRQDIESWTGQTGNIPEALRLASLLLPDMERILGPDHRGTFALRNDIAFWTGKTIGPAKGLSLFGSILTDQQKVLSPDDPDILRTRQNIAFFTGEAGDAKAAVILFQQLLPDMKRVRGPDHPETLKVRFNIALYLENSGEYSQALTLFRALLPDQQRVSGANHPDLFNTRLNIAILIGLTKDRKEALRLLNELLRDEIKAIAPQDPRILATRKFIAALSA